MGLKKHEMCPIQCQNVCHTQVIFSFMVLSDSLTSSNINLPSCSSPIMKVQSDALMQKAQHLLEDFLNSLYQVLCDGSENAFLMSPACIISL